MFGSKGEIKILIPTSMYNPGDVISGKAALTVKKPVKAREMSVSLVGEQKVTRQVRASNGHGTTTQTDTTRIYDFKQALDGEKEYSQPAEYPFQIKIPADILGSRAQMPEAQGGLAAGINILQQFAAMTGALPSQQTRWYLQAKLDIPGGLDISKNADLTIG